MRKFHIYKKSQALSKLTFWGHIDLPLVAL